MTRLVTDGTPNARSLQYGAARRAVFALGYRRLITYSRTDEGGASLRGAGWRVITTRPRRSWEADSRAHPRVQTSERAER